MRILTLILLLVLSLFTAASFGGESNSDASAFWRSFRKAVLHHDYDRLAAMTKFPFEVHGATDSDPVRCYERKAFPSVFQQILSQPVSLVTGGMIATKTMVEVIREKEDISDRDLKSGSMIRVQQLQFRRVNGEWLLIRAYLEEPY